MKILYLPPIPYRGLKQRPQYLAEGLAKEHELLYVDPTVSWMKTLLRGGEKPKGYRYPAAEGLEVLRMSGYRTAHRSLEAISPLFCLSEKRQLRPLLREADLVWVGYAPWYNLIRDFTGRIVYDKMDDDRQITQNPLLKRLLTQVEPALIDRADTIFVTAQRFYDEIHPRKERTFLLKNAVDFQQVPLWAAPSPPKQSGERIFGYVGMLSHWFDLDAIRTILDADERNRVVLVGPEEIPRLEHERLRYIGQVPKTEVGPWLARFDGCLYPFRKNAFLDTIDPVKIYEYLAANKPVLAADSLETRRFGEKLIRYRDSDDLRRRLSEDLRAPFSTKAEWTAFVEENTWENRLQIIREVL